MEKAELEKSFYLRNDQTNWPMFDSLVRKTCFMLSSVSKKKDKKGKFLELGTVYTRSDEAFIRLV